MSAEQDRLNDTGNGWKKWGPYVTDRQWGTVREDYSANGDAWSFITHDMARSKAYRWGEEGIAGICDNDQLLCFALSLWNKKDPIIKERYFGLNNPEGNHGEDVKELYYYLDNTPTHSYMKMLYKYPQSEYPYGKLVDENRRRTRNDPEFELIDTGVFDQNEYFDVFVEYAKNTSEDLLIKITVHNRSLHDASLNVLPTIWFRNTWAWGYDAYAPMLHGDSHGVIGIYHKKMGQYWLHAENPTEMLFCNNETNSQRLYGFDDGKHFCKDGINDYMVHKLPTVNPEKTGTKAAINYDITIPAAQSVTLRLRLSKDVKNEFDDFDPIFNARLKDADDFYSEILQSPLGDEANKVQRQAYAGMLWNKQFYYYDVNHWLHGDPTGPRPPAARLNARNAKWQHLNTRDIISMPDKWEYPWFASWDLAFHCLPIASIDMPFAKRQMLLLTRDWYMHPNGQLPAYEWDFNDSNPPVHAMVTWTIYKLDKENRGGQGDLKFLKRMFNKLMLNFTWWVNRKDASGNNIFEGGFLGLDNVGVFDRNTHLPNGETLEQADGTSWMAMYSLNLMRIATELATYDDAYADIASKFFEHFLYIVYAMSNLGDDQDGLWDQQDGFFYDQLRLPDNTGIKMRVRSIVGLIPLFATEVLDEADIAGSQLFDERLQWYAQNRPDMAKLVSRWNDKNTSGKHLISLLRGYRMKSLLRYMLDENEFLSKYGIRSVSKFHLANPFTVQLDGHQFSIKYTPAESDSGLFGGNSNWRGPIWVPINYLIINSLRKFHQYYGEDFKVECPTNSGIFKNLGEVADEIYMRLMNMFMPSEDGHRPIYGNYTKMQNDPEFKDYIQFFEYFDGDNGRGVGASHQTGWSGLMALCMLSSTARSEKIYK